jgi:hypothetical protein
MLLSSGRNSIKIPQALLPPWFIYAYHHQPEAKEVISTNHVVISR